MLLGVGLRITSFDEQQTVPWPAHPLIEPTGESWALPGPLRQVLPLTDSFTAVRER